MGSKNPERLIFSEDLAQYHSDLAARIERKPYVRDARGWCLFGPKDVRNGNSEYSFMLQRLRGQKLPRVRVGCRYYTLAEAWNHWGKRRHGQGDTRRNHCRQAVEIIRLMLLQAQAYGLLSLYSAPPRFDSTILKPKGW